MRPSIHDHDIPDPEVLKRVLVYLDTEPRRFRNIDPPIGLSEEGIGQSAPYGMDSLIKLRYWFVDEWLFRMRWGRLGYCGQDVKDGGEADVCVEEVGKELDVEGFGHLGAELEF